MTIRITTVTGSTAAMQSVPLPLNIYVNEFNKGIFISGGTTGVVDLQATPDAQPSTNSTWVSVSGFTSVSIPTFAKLDIPCGAVRLQSRANATGTFTLTVVEPQSA